MKKNGLNKLLALLLALVMVLALAACGNQAQDNGGAGNDADVVTDGTVADGATVGQGKTAFTMEVTQLDGTTVTFTVNTDKWARPCWSWASWPVTTPSTACMSRPSTA